MPDTAHRDATLAVILQGGIGIAVSDWHLAGAARAAADVIDYLPGEPAS